MPYPSDVDLKLVPNRHDTVPFTHTNSCANSAQDGGPRQVMPGKDSGIGSDLEVCSPSRRNEKMPSSDCDDIQKVESDLKSATIRLHYYPEGGWGWVICACAVLVEIVTQSLHTAYGMFYLEILYKYGQDKALEIGEYKTTTCASGKTSAIFDCLQWQPGRPEYSTVYCFPKVSTWGRLMGIKTPPNNLFVRLLSIRLHPLVR